ncbi:MAG: hypothetical protein ACI93T_001396, partial [Porticoccaceae bacterium]
MMSARAGSPDAMPYGDTLDARFCHALSFGP